MGDRVSTPRPDYRSEVVSSRARSMPSVSFARVWSGAGPSGQSQAYGAYMFENVSLSTSSLFVFESSTTVFAGSTSVVTV